MTLWLYYLQPGSTKVVRRNMHTSPAPTVLAAGAGLYYFWFREDGMKPPAVDTSKPPYSVPSMKEINAIPWNGLNVVSTFSGCGGTCLGYKMAGYRVLWASEFIPAAAETYKLNHPDTLLDTRDIRQVTGADILSSVGLQRGEVDILEGSPPCASFSTSGKREHFWGEVVKYSDTHQRVDDLFHEFIRLVDEVQPKVFVAENVSGLVKGVAKGYFKDILSRMRQLNYQVEVKLLNAAWLGVPQARERLFFIGVRNDLNKTPQYPKPFPYFYSLGDVLSNIQKVRLGGKPHSWVKATRPSPTIVVHGASTSLTGYLDAGGWVEAEASFTQKNGESYAVGTEWDKLPEGGHSKKYINLYRSSRKKPSPTVTATGGQPGAASVTHPMERRKFTIEELKLISSFPKDFQLTGTFTKQWERIGRAVPPFMAKAIAETLRDEVLS